MAVGAHVPYFFERLLTVEAVLRKYPLNITEVFRPEKLVRVTCGVCCYWSMWEDDDVATREVVDHMKVHTIEGPPWERT